MNELAFLGNKGVPLMSELPHGMRRFIASCGEVFFAFDNADTLAQARLTCGSRTIPLEPAPLRALPGEDLFTPSDMSGVTVEALNGVAPTISLNSSDIWTVEGGKTLFVRINERAPGSSFRVRLTNAATLRVRRGYRIEFLMAAHRFTGTLHVRFLNSEGDCIHSADQPIENGVEGGRKADSHRLVSVRVPDEARVKALEIVATVEAWCDPMSEVRPFLFLSNIRVWARGGISGPQHFMVSEGTGSFDAEAAATRRRRRFARLAARARVDGNAAVGAHAHVGPLDTVEALLITVGGKPYELPLPRVTALRHRKMEGPLWRFWSAGTRECAFFVNGAFVALVGVSEGINEVVVPRRFANGGVHALALTDEFGMRTLLSVDTVVSAVRTPYFTQQVFAKRPMPMPLAPQAAFRYDALRSALKEGPTPDEARQIFHAHEVLGLGWEHLRADDIKPLVFREHDAPDVSIVVPVHNGAAMTYTCLCALLLATCQATFEVVVVDDGSGADVASMLATVSGITVVRNEEPQRFIKACNAGVAASRGRYVALLNNDTEPTAGWLDELISPFRDDETVGLTGAKLIYPDNTLQEAGGVVWDTGDPANYGRGGNPMDPRYNYVRDAHYVSGAAMLTTRKVWDEVGGLSTYLEPMYFEDTDFAFKVRESGRRVVYTPHAAVYHYEGKTAGSDVSSGFKRFQEINRPKFKERWAGAFPAFQPKGSNLDRAKDLGAVGRVLFIDHDLPRPDQDAGSYATLEEMRLVRSIGFKVTFLPYNLAWLSTYGETVQKSGIEVVCSPFATSVAHYLAAEGTQFDAVYVYRYTVARETLDLIRRYAPQAKVIFMNADLHFLREIRSARHSGDADAMARAASVREEELNAVRGADLVLSYNDTEHAVLMSHVENVKVARCPWVVRARSDAPGPAAREGAMFLGGFRHPPNGEAVDWFTRHVWPALSPEQVGRFHIYGSSMPANIRALGSARVVPHGFVEKVSTAHDRHRVFVAPLMSGAGIKGKVLSAMADGLPCVLSPIAAEGIGVRPSLECEVAETPQEWCAAVMRLCEDDDAWQRFSDAGRAFVARHYSFEAGREAMRTAFNALGFSGLR